MDKQILDMINGAIVYASISTGVEYVKDECNEHRICTNCKFLNKEDHLCMFTGTPDCWDIETIENTVKGE